MLCFKAKFRKVFWLCRQNVTNKGSPYLISPEDAKVELSKLPPFKDGPEVADPAGMKCSFNIVFAIECGCIIFFRFSWRNVLRVGLRSNKFDDEYLISLSVLCNSKLNQVIVLNLDFFSDWFTGAFIVWYFRLVVYFHSALLFKVAQILVVPVH